MQYAILQEWERWRKKTKRSEELVGAAFTKWLPAAWYKGWLWLTNQAHQHHSDLNRKFRDHQTRRFRDHQSPRIRDQHRNRRNGIPMIYENRLTLLCKKRSEEQNPDKRTQLTEEILRLMPATEEKKKKKLRESSV
jgi:hypothetical protein